MNVNLSAFDSVGPIYGCNAMYRDNVADNIVSCNRKIVDEIIAAGGHTRCNFFTRPQWKRYYKKVPNVQFLPELPFDKSVKQDNSIKWSTGPLALHLAAMQNSDIVVMLGFDLYGIDKQINNVYKGTDNYAASDSKAQPYNAWVYQCAKVFELFPNTQFVQIQYSNFVAPEEWMKYENVMYDQFGSLSILLSDLEI